MVWKYKPVVPSHLQTLPRTQKEEIMTVAQFKRILKGLCLLPFMPLLCILLVALVLGTVLEAALE